MAVLASTRWCCLGLSADLRIGAAGGHVYVGSSDSQISYELRGIKRLAFSDQTTDLSTLFAEGKGEEMESVSKNGASTSTLLEVPRNPLLIYATSCLAPKPGKLPRQTGATTF